MNPIGRKVVAQVIEFHIKGRNFDSRGFTLVELSIVILVISLFTTAILVGKDLIRSAELQSVITDVGSFRTAVNNFEMQFGKKPGDLKNASDYWPDICIDDNLNLCNGNGDEKIFPSGSEGLRVWQHLNLAGMLPGSYSGISDIFLDDLALREINTVPRFQFANLFIGSAFATKGSAGADEYTICHSDSTITVSGDGLELHLYHGDSMGACGDSGGQGKHKVSMCHSGGTITVAIPAVIQAHLNHGDSTGECSEEEDDTEVADNDNDDGSDSNDSDKGDEGDEGDNSDDDSDDDGGGGEDVYVEVEVEEEEYVSPYSRFTIGYNVPSSKVDFGGFKIGRVNGRNSITFAAEHYPLLTGSILTPLEAWIIDNKIDDGEAGEGNVNTSRGEDEGGCVGVNGYNFNNGNMACRVHFLFD